MQRVLRFAGLLTLVVGLAACDRNGTDDQARNDGARGAAGTTGMTADPRDPSGAPGAVGTSGTQDPAGARPDMPQDLPHFAMMSNHAEIELGRLALQKARNPQVKQFARQMVDDHTKAMQQLEKLAGSSAAHRDQPSTTGQTGAHGTPHTGQQPGRHPSGQHPAGHAGQRHHLDAEHQQIYDRLSALSGAEFDREFMRVMVESHQTAVARFQQETRDTGGTTMPRGTDSPAGADRPTGTTGGTDPAAINRWAKQTLPTLQKHLERAQQIQSRLDQPRNR